MSNQVSPGKHPTLVAFVLPCTMTAVGASVRIHVIGKESTGE